MKRKTPSQPIRAPQATAPPERGFRDDLREIVIPANKWHYAFHAIVIVVALAYWLGSLIFVPQASWAEMIMYRPGGDNQVWPVITALSRFNFGDPTDALKYGQGIGGFHAVILLPYAIAYAVFGGPGYMVADAVLSWCYFVAAAMLFRRWGMSLLSSAGLSAALTTASLQAALQLVSQAFSKLLDLFGRAMAESDFPSIFSLALSGKRLPRPMPTEILVLLILYFLTRQWHERRLPTYKRGLALGILMGLLAQGDPYSFSALGLLALAVLVWSMSFQKWKVPWRFSIGALGGAVLAGWYFVVQLLGQHPDSAARFGLATYSRSKILLLPGYAPWVRLVLVTCLVIAICVLVRRRKTKAHRPAGKVPHDSNPDAATVLSPEVDLNVSRALAFFALAMVAAAWLAQPLQLFLLGKGAQIYHYAYYTLPTFYSLAVLLLLIRLFKVLNAPEEIEERATSPLWSRRATGVCCGVLLGFMGLLGADDAMTVIKHSGVSRRDNSPWVAFGNAYRPSLRAIDKEFRENPVLKNTRSFATFNQEVNFLLAAFHDKRAYLPDNAFTTLSDEELELRLFEVCKLWQISVERFANIIQDWYTLNYWLGCAKYWCASDYKFSRDEDYIPQQLENVRQMGKQAPFNLVLPKSEFDRLTAKYDEVLQRPSDVTTYPDAVVASAILKEHRLVIDPALYRETYTNAIFTIYTRIPQN